MKMRILGDSLRLRLSKSDVARFCEKGRLEQVTRFAPGSGLTYALEHSGDVTSLQATFNGSTVTVRMPTQMAHSWAQSQRVSLRAEQTVEPGIGLALLVEKDFKCAIVRPGEEAYDGFERPPTDAL